MGRRVPKVALPPRLWTNPGQKWETELDHYHETYNANRQACVFRTPAEIKIVGRGKRIHTRKRGVPDFTGVVGPTAVLIEAKTSLEKSFPLSLIDEDQAATMSDWEDQGPHDSFVMYFDRERELRWCIPWEDLRSRWERWHRDDFKHGEGSVTMEQLERFAFTFDPIQGWLPAVLRWWRDHD